MIFRRSLTQELYATALATFLTLVGIVLAQRVALYLGVAARGSLASDAIGALLGFSLLRNIDCDYAASVVREGAPDDQI